MAARKEHLVDVVTVKFSGGKTATVTIPKLIRDRLGIKTGARFSVCIDPEADRIIYTVLKDETILNGEAC